MQNDDKQQVVGLAATVQSLTLVNQIATKGEFDRDAAEPVLRALFVYSPDTALEAYGNNSANLFLGNSTLQRILKAQQVSDVATYLLNVLSVESKLVRKDSLLTTLREGCQQIAHDLVENEPQQDLLAENSDDELDNADFDDDFDDDFGDDVSESSAHGLTAEHILSEVGAEKIATLYKQTASTVEPRIMINGDAKFLRDPEHANWIRALLLASMRGASFFRHYGGSRVNMLMKRSTYMDELKRM